MDWLLSVEERKCTNQSFLLSFMNEPPIDSSRPIEKDLRRHLRGIWRSCAQPPPSVSSASSAGGSSYLHGQPRSATSSSRYERKQKSKDKLFNPKYGSVSTPGDVLAALCFLTSAFLQLRCTTPGSMQDAERASLRLALAALARHSVFDTNSRSRERADTPAGNGRVETDPQFLRWSIALLCFMDAALSWCPVDPLGWLGSCEDDAGLIVAHVSGYCSFPALAVRLRCYLKRAQDGCRVTWRRLGVHMDNIRSREIPDPWPWAWVQASDGSILVRNRTKVPLRVELHRPSNTLPSPWADLPLLRAYLSQAEPVLVAEVGPGIEWALRPQARAGRHFQMRLLTQAGVQVCSRHLNRGQTFDFSINIPSEVKHGSLVASRSPIRCIDRSSANAVPCKPRKAIERRRSVEDRKPSQSSALEPRLSQCSTAVPSVASAHAVSEDSDGDRMPKGTSPGAASPMASGDALDTAICPRCLAYMASRYSRPAASEYADGVRCDRCGVEAPCPKNRIMGGSKYFHCSHCWFDLCYVCAMQEMRDVWWGQD